MTTIEAEALALVEALNRVDCTADQVSTLSLLDRLLAGSIAGVVNATDQHWVLVQRLFQAQAAAA